MKRRIVLVDIGAGLVLTGVLPSAALHNAYSARVSARGGVAPYTYSVVSGELPPGMAVDAGTGMLSGDDLSTAGSFTFMLRATDLMGSTADRAFRVIVTGDVMPPELVLTGDFAAGVVGVAYMSDLTISGGDGNYSNPRVIDGMLPGWATLSIVDDKLRLTGTPSAPTIIDFTVAVDSGDSQTAVSNQVVVVDLPTAFADVVTALSPVVLYRLNEMVGTLAMNAVGASHDGSLRADASSLTTDGLITGDSDRAMMCASGSTPGLLSCAPAVGPLGNATVQAVIMPTSPPPSGIGVVFQCARAVSSSARNTPEIDIVDLGGGQFGFRVMKSGVSELFAAGTYAYGTRLCMHLRWTSAGDVSLRVNGITIGSATAAGFQNYADRHRIGYAEFVGGNPYAFAGVIDELAFFTRVLTDTECDSIASLI